MRTRTFKADRRRGRVASLLLAVGLLAACGGSGAAESQAVTETFQAYRQALLAGDGDEAVRHVSAGTFEYYEELRTLAASGDAAAIAARPLVDRLGLASLCTVIGPEEAANMSPQELVASAVDRGMIGDSVEGTELGEVSVSGDTATAPAVIGGQTAEGVDYTFRREGGQWKIDLVALLQFAGTGFAETAREAGISEGDLEREVLASLGVEQPRETAYGCA